LPKKAGAPQGKTLVTKGGRFSILEELGKGRVGKRRINAKKGEISRDGR